MRHGSSFLEWISRGTVDALSRRVTKSTLTPFLLNRLSTLEAAELLWEQFIEQAEISYERPKAVQMP